MTRIKTNIFSLNDELHKSYVREIIELIPEFEFNANYIDYGTEKLTIENPVMANLGNDIALLSVSALPYPFPDNTNVLSVFKSGIKDRHYYALISNGTENATRDILAKYDVRNTLGKVYLVGAGQNSKEHLTLKAYDLIQSADIIFYDSLIDASILDESKAEKIFVGKRANKHFKLQDDINQLLFNAATEHKTVVRLKGGDPMIFGHAGEEIAYLEAKLIEVETVPGITSPLGAATCANLPLTLRNISDSVSFCSAHEKTKILVPETDTIVYFMGASNLQNVAKALVKNNRPNTTPIILFYNIGGTDQEVYYETIETVLNNNTEYKSPLLAVVGEVGNRKNWHKSFDYKPKILFTGTHIAKYAHLGYVYHQPMIQIVPLENFNEVDTEIKNLSSYDWIVFTSMYAAGHFLNRLLDLGMDARSLSNIKIASIGRVTSKKLRSYGLIPDLQATEESSEGIIKKFVENEIKNSNVLIPRSNLAHDFLPNQLSGLGNNVKKLSVYLNTQPEINKKVEIENFDQVIFTSPSGVDNFIKVYGKLPRKPEIISRGKETQKRINYYVNDE